MRREYKRWAILRPGNALTPDYLMGDMTTGMTGLYRTRREARNCPEMKDYNIMLRRRPDLRQPPHSWRAKRPVKVLVTVEVVE